MIMELWIDDRERAVLEFASSTDEVSIQKCRLEIGDFCVVYKGQMLMCIERKTWKDFSASLKDGRKDNVRKLLELRKRTNCHIIYLLEGSQLSLKAHVGRIPFTNILAHMDHLMMRDGIHFVYSKSPQYSFERLMLLIKHWQSLPMIERPVAPESVMTPSELKEICPKKSDADKTLELFKSLKHVSEKTALALSENIHISDLLCNRVEMNVIAQMQYCNGKCIGQNRAKKILANMYPFSVLCALPGVSRVTAKAILDEFDIENICNGADLAEVRVSNRKIGKNVINAIQQYLNPKIE